MEVYIAEYHTFDDGRHEKQVAEVFTSYDGYVLWLVQQLRHPDHQHIEGKGRGLSLITTYSDTEWTMYSLLIKTTLD